VTVATINAVVADVMLVRKLDGLLALDKRACIIRGAVNQRQHPHSGSRDKNRSEDTHLCQCVRAVVKNLRHGFPSDPLAVFAQKPYN
jgi:hypothetical protein